MIVPMVNVGAANTKVSTSLKPDWTSVEKLQSAERCEIFLLTCQQQQRGSTVNILNRIKADHEVQRRLMDRILETEGDSASRRDLFSQFSAEYKAHAAAEEDAFYAALMHEPESTDQSRHSVAEHHEAMELLEELENKDMSSPGWLMTFKKLVEENSHHMEEEEDDVFPLAESALGDARLKELLNDFDERKSTELG